MYPFFRLTMVLCVLLAVPLAVVAQEVAPQAANQSPRMITFDDKPTVKLDVTGAQLAKGTLSKDARFAFPTGKVSDRQVLQIEVFTATPIQVTWAEGYVADYGLPLPTQTRAGYTLWGWRYHGEDKAWHLIATTPPPASAAAR